MITPKAQGSHPEVAEFDPRERTVRTTRLVTVAHGTRTPQGNHVAAALTVAAGRRLGWAATTSYVELCEPSLVDVLAEGVAERVAEGLAEGLAERVAGGLAEPVPGGAGADVPTVVVPLLLSTGVHVRKDLPEAIGAAGAAVALGGALGPDALLAAAQVERLREAGALPGRPVVLVAAGSSDPAATADLETAARLLGEAWGAPVRLATLSGRGRRPDEVLRRGDAVSPYLLATGHFHRLVDAAAREAGADTVADVIGPHPAVVELICRRARGLVAPSVAVA